MEDLIQSLRSVLLDMGQLIRFCFNSSQGLSSSDKFRNKEWPNYNRWPFLLSIEGVPFCPLGSAASEISHWPKKLPLYDSRR
jgi:hypothetical protein